MNRMQLRATPRHRRTKNATRARGGTRSCMPASTTCLPSTPCRTKRKIRDGKCPRLESCSRDPIGYEGSKWNLFEYVQSHPLTGRDPSGKDNICNLKCALPRRPLSMCCGNAKREGIDGGHLGGVVCCDGRKVSCVWSENFPILYKDDLTAWELIRDCVERHEDTHLLDVANCQDPCHRGVKRGGTLTPLHRPGSECRAYRAELSCLHRSISRCSGDPACEVIVDTRIAHVRAQISGWCILWADQSPLRL
jgi:hypothetical protein